jgi:hypothetical protein
MTDLRGKLTKLLESGFRDEALAAAKKQITNLCCDLEMDLEYSIKSDLAYNLAGWVNRMAEDAVRAILNGDEELMRSNLSCCEYSYTGRDREHPVIHGKLFETGAIELRKKIVDAYPELLKNERILDLEDQVKNLVSQVNKAEREKNSMWERLRGYE